MKIAFVTEMNLSGKIPDEYRNMRTEFVWMKALDATHFSYEKLSSDMNTFSALQDFDVIFFIPSKKHPEYLHIIENINGFKCILQEGPRTLWLDWPFQYQLLYTKILNNDVDMVFAHNSVDTVYFQSLTSKPVYAIPTVHFIDEFKKLRIPMKDKKNSILIGGNMTSWYGGMHSYLAIKDYNWDKIGILTMGRRQSDEEKVLQETDKRIEYIPYMNFYDYMDAIRTYKYAIHLMPVSAAGSFYLNMAMLGIPCIANNMDDTSLLFKDLIVDCNGPYVIQDAKQRVDEMLMLKEDWIKETDERLNTYSTDNLKSNILMLLEKYKNDTKRK